MSTVDTLDTTDTPWITKIIDIVEASIGMPWRVALDEIELAPLAPHRLRAVTAALRRAGGSASHYTPLARRARALVLGPPVLTDADRNARIAAAAASLGIAEHELEAALWSDLPGQRTIELPGGRPHELAIAAAANVLLVQRALRRAQLVRLRIWPTGRADADGTLLRAALSRGLLVTASRGESGETLLDIVGPLALFHRTSVYARALGQLVPLLAACERFELVLECETGTSAYRSRLASPVLLPLEPVHGASSRIAEQLAIALARRAPELPITLAPPPIGAHLLCPDLVVGDWHIELVGFWTREYLERKLDRYRAAGIEHVILCVDDARLLSRSASGLADGADRTGGEAKDPPAGVIGYTKRVDADRVLEVVNPRSYRSRGA